MQSSREYQRAPASGQQGLWSGPQQFRIEQCSTCELHKVVLAGETWPVSDGSVLLFFPLSPLQIGSRPTDCIRSAGWKAEYWEKAVRGRIAVPGKSGKAVTKVEGQLLQIIRQALTGHCEPSQRGVWMDADRVLMDGDEIVGHRD